MDTNKKPTTAINQSRRNSLKYLSAFGALGLTGCCFNRRPEPEITEQTLRSLKSGGGELRLLSPESLPT